MAASASAWAQNAGDQALRGSIAPNETGDGGPQGAAAATTPVSTDSAKPTPVSRSRPRPVLGAPDSPPLGLGDEPKGPLPTQPLGGIGDQPPTDPREAPDLDVTEEPSPIGEGEGLEEALGLAAPDTEEEERAQIHSALAPEPHDLEPYLPIGVRLGTFLLYPEAEFGTILTNNVLDTRFDTHSDVGAEVAPRLRVESRLEPACLQRGDQCRSELVQQLSDRGREQLPGPA
jgi:hypothetical protein